MAENKTWGIIGGGILGMTLALRLSENGYKVMIFEADGKAGGLASSWEMDGIVWDKFYHVILMSDLHTRKIIKEIGLENDLRWAETKTGFYSNGKLVSMSNLIEFFKFPPINLFDKFRLGLTIFVASRIKNWRRLESIPVSDWLIRWSGKSVFEKIWLPLLKAKLGDNYKNTSAAFIWTTIQRMYAARRSRLKKEMFGYLSGGYDRIITQFTEHLTGMGVEFRFNSKVRSVRQKENESLEIILTDGLSFEFNNVISTIPSGFSAEIAEGLSNEQKQQHKDIKYLGVVCPAIILKKAISHYYVTNIIDNGPPFTGIIEMTALIDRREVKGNHLVYLPKYVNPDDPLFDTNDDKIRELFIGALLSMYSHLNEDDILFWGVSKSRNVLALPILDYSVRLPGIATAMKNYYIVNSAQIINGTLNVNETIQVAEEKLNEILNG